MRGNLFDGIPGALPEELSTVLAEGGGVTIERIVSDGHASPEGFWYDQARDEWVLLVSGSAVLSVETENGVERIELGPGDHLQIPARRRHRIEATSPTEKTIWLAVFHAPR
jgi:cupin 2 domain-containing protein